MRDTHSRPAQTCKACGGTWPCPGLAGWREPVNLPRFASWFSNVYFAFLFMVVRVTPLSAVSRHICHELLQACRPCWKQAPGRVVLLCAVQLMQLRFFFLRT